MALSTIASAFIALSPFFAHVIADLTTEEVAELTNSQKGVESSKNFYYGSEANPKLLCECFQSVEEYSSTLVKIISEIEVGETKSGAVVMCYKKANNDEINNKSTSETYFALTKYLFYYIKVVFDKQHNTITSYVDEIDFHKQDYKNGYCEELRRKIWIHIENEVKNNANNNEDNVGGNEHINGEEENNETEEEDNDKGEVNRDGKYREYEPVENEIEEKQYILFGGNDGNEYEYYEKAVNPATS